MEARSEHVADVKAFLNVGIFLIHRLARSIINFCVCQSIVPNDEAKTLQWFAFQVEGTNVLGITGYFADEPSR